MNHKNFAQTTLASAITDTSGTSITVTSSTGFPSVPFIISIDTEAFSVTTVAGTTWTVTRGYEGSTAATHLVGAAIFHDISAAETDSIATKKADSVSATDKILGRVTAGAGAIEEIACTAAGRAILDDASAAAQLATLGTAAYSEGTWTPVLNSFTIVGAAPAVSGKYKRIGNLVVVTCQIVAGSGGNTSVAAGSGCTVTGIPVNAINVIYAVAADHYGSSLGAADITTNTTYIPVFSAQTNLIRINAIYFA